MFGKVVNGIDFSGNFIEILLKKLLAQITLIFPDNFIIIKANNSFGRERHGKFNAGI